MRWFKTLLTVIGAVTVLVLAGNTLTLAATGHPLITGQGNKAKKITSLKRTTDGAALRLKTTPTSAPLEVTGRGRVANLNADQVDGVEGADLLTRSLVFRAAVVSYDDYVRVTLPLPDGSWLVSFAAHLKMQSTPHGEAECYLTYLDGTDNFLADTTFEPGSSNPSLTGSDLVTKPAGVGVALECTSATPFITASNLPLKVVATRVDQVTELTPSISFP
jgi:hypothetical protein